jgi:hypothetical protein
MAYIGNAPADRFTSIPTVQQFNGDGSTTAFTLSRPVGTDQDLLVSVDGVIQDTAAYAVSNGTTLTFSAAPSTGTANIFVNYLGVTIGSVVHPASSSISAAGASLDGAVTINESSADVDFRVESDTGTHALFVQGSDGNVGIGTSSPSSRLEVQSPDNTLATNIFKYTSLNGNAGLKFGYQRIEQIGSTVPITFNTGGSEAMRIDASGNVTKPSQPAFLAHPASVQSDIAINSEVTVVLGTEVFDVGSNFASNTFTAPVTGKYQFNVVIRLANLSQTAAYYRMYFKTSNKTYYAIMDPDFGQDTVYWSLTLSALADMDEDDTAIVRMFQSGGTSQTDINPDTFFSGYLAC